MSTNGTNRKADIAVLLGTVVIPETAIVWKNDNVVVKNLTGDTLTFTGAINGTMQPNEPKNKKEFDISGLEARSEHNGLYHQESWQGGRKGPSGSVQGRENHH